MASKALSNPLIRQVAKRGYAQAAPAVKNDIRIQSSVLPSKTIVAALDNNSPVTRVTVAFKAGSRYEPASELGISHVLRASAGLTTGRASGFIVARKLAQMGASITASGDREFIYYTLEATQENLQGALEMLNNVISKQEFRPWDLSDNAPRIKYEITALNPQARAVDLLHKAAYRRGLGNSLFISPRRIGKVSSESLQHFASTTLTPSRCAVTVIGDSKDKATLVAQALQLSGSGDAQTEATTYYGGELRKEMGGDLAHVALAIQGASAGTPASLALAIAAKAFGNGPVTKWGADNSPIAKSIGNVGPFAAAGFNVSYSDSGLFGIILTVPKDEATATVKAAASLLKSPKLSADALKAGRNQLKLQILSEADTASSLSEAIAAQGLYTGSVKSPAELASEVDKITDQAISQALSAASKTKISMGAAGNLAFVPFADEV